MYRIVKEGVERLDLRPREGDRLFAEEQGAEGGLCYRQLGCCHCASIRMPAGAQVDEQRMCCCEGVSGGVGDVEVAATKRELSEKS